MARHLGELLAETWAARGDRDFDVVVPVPIHRSRRRARGFNQAALLGAALSKATGLPLDETLLAKIEAREPQAGLPKAQRRANAGGAYAADPKVAGRRVLLVDDIATTREALRACAAEWTEREGQKVAALVGARTPSRRADRSDRAAHGGANDPRTANWPTARRPIGHIGQIKPVSADADSRRESVRALECTRRMRVRLSGNLRDDVKQEVAQLGVVLAERLDNPGVGHRRCAGHTEL